MMNLLFYVPLYVYEVQEWDRKKQALLSRIKNNTFDYHGIADFQSDRNFQKNKYALDFEGIFCDELEQFKKEAHLQYLKVKDVWTLKYTKKNENHCPHNHSSTGYTGILYLEYDPKVHEPTKFIGPWNDPVSDTTQLAMLPDPKPGVIYIWPSSVLHYADGMKTNKLRMVTSWDMEVR